MIIVTAIVPSQHPTNAPFSLSLTFWLWSVCSYLPSSLWLFLWVSSPNPLLGAQIRVRLTWAPRNLQGQCKGRAPKDTLAECPHTPRWPRSASRLGDTTGTFGGAACVHPPTSLLAFPTQNNLNWHPNPDKESLGWICSIENMLEGNIREKCISKSILTNWKIVFWSAFILFSCLAVEIDK